VDGIYEYIFNETKRAIEDILPNEVVITETSKTKFTIVVLEHGSVIIKVDRRFIPLMNEYVLTYRDNLFSDNAINFIKEHFRLNNPVCPCEYIYGLISGHKMAPVSIFTTTVQINLETLKAMDHNPFQKYPFKHPNENLIYFGTYDKGELVALVSGYLGDDKAVELTGETLPEYRKLGFAKSNTAVITNYLLEQGFDVMTTNAVSNSASIHTVVSLGFQRYGCQLAFYAID
jgi:hypothetical protein